MAKCRFCDKWGLLLKLSPNGLCVPCELQLQMDLANTSRIMNESIDLFEHSKNYEIRISRCDVFIRQASILRKYEEKGVATTEPPPSKLILSVQARKEEIIRERESIAVATCPSCAVVLRRIPKRKTTCPSCRRPMFVRDGKLYTEDESRALDWCSRSGVEESKMYVTQKDLSAKSGRTVSYTEAAWQLCRDRKHEEIRARLAGYREEEKAGLFDLSEWEIEIIGSGECSACSPFNCSRFTFEEFERIMPLPVAECTHERTAHNPRGWCRCTWGLTKKNS